MATFYAGKKSMLFIINTSDQENKGAETSGEEARFGHVFNSLPEHLTLAVL